MATVSDLLSVARAEVGYCRWDDPEQGTKYGRWYAGIMGAPWFGTSGVPFCAMFVSWCLDRAGVSCEGFPRAVAIDARDGLSREVNKWELQPGDIVGFDWDGDNGGDHVGIVAERLAAGKYRTIEGNTSGSDGRSGSVAVKTRHASQITCGVRPTYSGPSSGIAVDGAAGTETIGAWSRQLGSPYSDSDVISGQHEGDTKWRRCVWSVTNEGTGESWLVKEVQGIIGASVDGFWGYQTSGKLQGHLRARGYYTGQIDHDFAHHSVEALQRSINDGIWKR